MHLETLVREIGTQPWHYPQLGFVIDGLELIYSGPGIYTGFPVTCTVCLANLDGQAHWLIRTIDEKEQLGFYCLKDFPYVARIKYLSIYRAKRVIPLSEGRVQVWMDDDSGPFEETVQVSGKHPQWGNRFIQAGNNLQFWWTE